MEEFPTLSWYVARRLDVPLALAASALDRIAGDELRVGGPWGELTATAVPVDLIRSRAARHRRLRGRLRIPLRRAVRVDLELTPWSSSACELGLRPDSSPHGARADAYFATAGIALEQLRLDLVTVLARHRLEREVGTDTELERAS